MFFDLENHLKIKVLKDSNIKIAIGKLLSRCMLLSIRIVYKRNVRIHRSITTDNLFVSSFVLVKRHQDLLLLLFAR
jgi:hypothetical protein